MAYRDNNKNNLVNYNSLDKTQKRQTLRYVYLIGSGEFEITIKTLVDKKEEEDQS